MKDALVLLWLLSVHTFQVRSQAYEADSDGNCLDSKMHYKLEGTSLCCNKCKPGYRLREDCTTDSDTVCELCAADQYLEQMNYSPNCLGCSPCLPEKGLMYLQSCSPTTNSRCGCQPGRYCIMGFNAPYCELCAKYKTCKAGFGVSVPGTASRNVRCAECPPGTFSDTDSYTDRCRPHTNCDGRAVTRQGNATADTECEPQAFLSDTNPKTTTEEPLPTTLTTSTGPTSVATDLVPESTKDASPRVTLLPRQTKANSEDVSLPLLAAAIAGAAGALILLIAFVLLLLWKVARGKGAARPCDKVDANGNCDAGEKDTQLISYTQEEERLLKDGEDSSNRSQSSNSTDLLTRSDDCSSFESIGPLQSTAAPHGQHSALSEPMTLRSCTESAAPQTSIPTQPPSSQPTSPHVISPITTSPHVNVNITFNIGNGSERTQCVTPSSLVQSDCQLSFGETEETFSIPQQEAGKESVVTVQESTAFCA